MQSSVLILLFILPQLYTLSSAAVVPPRTLKDGGIAYQPPPRTCLDGLCEQGEVCQLQQVACFRAPCPPIPVCKPRNDTVCPRNERRVECGSCEGSCKTGPPQICPMICRLGSPCSCVYGDGNVRDNNGACVPMSQCPGVLTCQTVNCLTGHICQMVDSDCTSRNATSPCWPTPRCIPAPFE